MTDLLTSVAPVFTVDGERVGDLARDVTCLEIEEATDGMKTLRLRLLAEGPREGASDETELYLDGRVIDLGKTLEVSLGPSDDSHVVFTGLISALQAEFRNGAEPHVSVHAEDKLMALRMTRRMRTYEQVSDAEIASAIASEHGLTPDASADGPTYDRVQQWNQSDLAFLRERARLVQAEVWLDGDTLHFASRGNRTADTISLIAGDDLVDVQLRADLAHQRTSVKVSGYDASARDHIDEEAGADTIQSEVSGGRSGAQILQQAFGDRVSYRVRNVPLVSGEAHDWARAEMLRRARGFVTVSGTTNGTPAMRVGSRLTLDRVGAPFNGDGYYVTHVCHAYDLEQGYRTRFEAERATINEAS